MTVGTTPMSNTIFLNSATACKSEINESIIRSINGELMLRGSAQIHTTKGYTVAKNVLFKNSSNVESVNCDAKVAPFLAYVGARIDLKATVNKKQPLPLSTRHRKSVDRKLPDR